jgi:sulfofructose kinase
MTRVLSVGVATLDTIVLVDKYPSANERVVAKQTTRAGIDVSLACVIGDDEAGRYIFDTLKREGVDTKNVEIDSNTTTAIGTIIVSKSEQSRAIMVQPHNKVPQKPANISDYQWIHVDQVGMQVLKDWGIKRGGGAKISIDIGYQSPGLNSADYDLYVPSENVTSDVTTAKQDKNLVVISQGEKGSIYSDGIDTGVVKALDLEILSTLGAGDVFHGALLAAQIWEKTIKESVEIANVVAGLSCRGLDGQSGIPRKNELDAYMAKAKI